jgi:hypothetical protein
MMIHREMAEWRARSATRAMRDERDGRDGRRFEVRSSRFPELRTLNFVSRFARQSHLSLLSQTSAIAAEALMNNAG